MIAACPQFSAVRADRATGGIAGLIDTAARLTGISAAEILGLRQSRHVVDVRWAVAVAASRKGYTTTQIGTRLQRDHSTIVHALRVGRSRGEVMALAEQLGAN